MTQEPLQSNDATPTSGTSAVQTPARDPLDPLGQELQVVCKDCDKEFKVPYRHFQAGVVFHCPHCRGSYVPTLPMYRKVHDTVEAFYGRMRQEREEMARDGTVDIAFTQRLEAESTEFQKALQRLARELRPAGKMVRRKGLAAMFT